MKLLVVIFMIIVSSIDASDLTSRLCKSAIQAATVNVRHDIGNNALLAHHHIKHAGAFYDIILTKSLHDGSLTVKSYKSSIKAGAVVLPLSGDEEQAIFDLLRNRIG